MVAERGETRGEGSGTNEECASAVGGSASAAKCGCWCEGPPCKTRAGAPPCCVDEFRAASSAACAYQALGMTQLHGTASGLHGQPPCQLRMATVTPSSHCHWRRQCQHPWLQQQPWHHGRPSLMTCSSQQQATLARDVRAMPIKVVTVSKGNSQGATLMASEWSEKVGPHQLIRRTLWQ